jgi:hypothetical protein
MAASRRWLIAGVSLPIVLAATVFTAVSASALDASGGFQSSGGSKSCALEIFNGTRDGLRAVESSGFLRGEAARHTEHRGGRAVFTGSPPCVGTVTWQATKTRTDEVKIAIDREGERPVVIAKGLRYSLQQKSKDTWAVSIY